MHFFALNIHLLLYGSLFSLYNLIFLHLNIHAHSGNFGKYVDSGIWNPCKVCYYYSSQTSNS
mgnify:CR=1